MTPDYGSTAGRAMFETYDVMISSFASGCVAMALDDLTWLIKFDRLQMSNFYVNGRVLERSDSTTLMNILSQ